MDRARHLIEPYTRREGVRGMYLVGSGSRPFRDSISDYDFEVAVDDAVYAALPEAERHVFVMDEGPPRRVDHEFYLRPWGELEGLRSSTRDLDHYPFQFARVLHDPSGELSSLVAELGTLPADVRETRCSVHYLDFIVPTRRAAKCFNRGDALNTRLVLNDAAAGLIKLLFVAKGMWPPLKHWARQEMRLAGIGDDIPARLQAMLDEPSAPRVAELVESVHAWLDAEGLTLHRDPMALFRWAFLTEEGKRAAATWGAR
jgi:hypothetical protein